MYNSALGFYAGINNTTGSYNTLLGTDAGYNNTTGSGNSFVGYGSGISNTTGNYNSALGMYSGVSNTTGSLNTMVGVDAGYANTTGTGNSYFGFGAGAHSFDVRVRWANVHDPNAYVAAISKGSTASESIGVVTASEALDEELFLGLRQLEGIDLARIEKEYNVRLQPRIEALRDQGLLELDGSRVRLAPARLAVSNAVFVELMS